MIVCRLFVATAVLTLSACATTAFSTGAEFPSAEKVGELAGRPPPKVEFAASSKLPATWTLEGPFPERIEQADRAPVSPWEVDLHRALTQRGGSMRMTEALHCVAREVGRYQLEVGESPPSDLLELIGGRCGTIARLRTRGWQGEVPDSQPDSVVYESWGADFRKGLEETLAKGGAEVGVWAGRKDGRAEVLVVVGRHEARLEPLERHREDATWVLRGRVFEPVEAVVALINRGEYGFAKCEPAPGVEPPAFELRCQGAKEDAEAWIALYTRKKGRFLMDGVANVLVSPSGQPAGDFQRKTFASTVSPEIGFAPAFTRLVNEVRKQAGLTPLELELAQSRTAKRVAPHFFAATQGEDPEKVADTIALGMMAGWDVQAGSIHDGSFTADWISGTRDLRLLVANLLTYPGGRQALLDPEARSLAVGEVELAEKDVLAVVASTYFLLEPMSLREKSQKVMDALNKARAARGLRPARWASAPGGSDEAAVRLLAEGEDPQEGTRLMLDAAMEITGVGMKGWTLAARTLDEISFPDELLNAHDLTVVLAVGEWRAPDSPWTSYIIMMVLADSDSVKPVRV